MAQTLGSPGVYTKETDQTFVQPAVSEAGPLVIGETEKGPAFVPTEVSSFTEFEKKFGIHTDDNFVPYYASSTLRHSDKLTIVRTLGLGYGANGALLIQSASYGAKGSELIIGVIRPTANGAAAGDWEAYIFQGSSGSNCHLSMSGNGTAALYSSMSLGKDDNNYIGNIIGFNPRGTTLGYIDKIFNYAYTTGTIALESSADTAFPISMAITEGDNFTYEYSDAETPAIQSQYYGDTKYNLFKVHTRSHGNNANAEIKIEIKDIRPSVAPSVNPYGTFTIIIRDFGDSNKRPIVFDAYPNLTLDPDSPNYIARRLGNRRPSYNVAQRKLDWIGEFTNKSDFIWVEMYDQAGIPGTAVPWGFAAYSVWPSNSAAMPFSTGYSINAQYSVKGVPGIDYDQYGIENLFVANPENKAGSTSQSAFTLASASAIAAQNPGTPYDSSVIDLTSNTPVALRKFVVAPAGGFDGLKPTGRSYGYGNDGKMDCTSGNSSGTLAFKRGLDVIANSEEYDFDIMSIAGLNYSDHAAVVNYAENILEDRGNDAMLIFDPYPSGTYSTETITDAISGIDNSYMATYWPWIYVSNPQRNKHVLKPPTTEVMGAIKFSDAVSHPWFAPAGLNRASLTRVREAEIRLSSADRKSLYDGRVNPLATFKDEGVVVWGQKNLQVAESLLDRINVRRLLITAKKLIVFVARYRLFDPNDATNRNTLLDEINPILDEIRQNRGLHDFKVILDESNNTPDVVDRNIMYGQIFLAPIAATEYVVLDFNISKSGVNFSDI